MVNQQPEFLFHIRLQKNNHEIWVLIKILFSLLSFIKPYVPSKTSGVVIFFVVKNDKAIARYNDTRLLGGIGPQCLPLNGEFISSAGSDDCISAYISMYSCKHLKS